MNFEPALEPLVMHAAATRLRCGPTPRRSAHRPSIALILLATAVQIIAMAAMLGTVASAAQ